MTQKKISVIVPIYNSEKYLEQCLQSLRLQTVEDIEFLLIDDGSTDASATICEKFCHKDSRFIYVLQKHAGISCARNNGLNRATGEYIGFCDSDDWVDPNMYESLYKRLVETDAEIAVCAYETEYMDGHAAKDIRSITTDMETDAETAVAYLYCGKNVGMGFLWNKLIRRSFIGSDRFDEALYMYEDLLFLVTLYAKCSRFVFLHDRFYHYRINTNSASHGKYKDTDWSALQAHEKVCALIRARFPALIHYAEKERMLACLALADKLIDAGKFNKESYRQIKSHIKSCCVKKSIRSANFRKRLSIRTFLFGYRFYIWLRKTVQTVR